MIYKNGERMRDFWGLCERMRDFGGLFGARCVLFPSTREPNSYFEGKMASTFGEEKSVDTHFSQWLISISLYSTLARNISTMCAHRTRSTFCVKARSNGHDS